MKVLRIILIIAAIFITVPLVIACLFYSPIYVYRVLVWQESDAFDWQKFPNHPLTASPTPYIFEELPDPSVPALFEKLSGTQDWDAFLRANHTQAFTVIKDNKLVYENYSNDTHRDSIVTTFSVAKSFVSALVGLAIQDGYIHSLDNPITNYLPELIARDPRFEQITIRNLVRMSSGLDYQEFRWALINGDDPLTTYYPDQRKLALENTHIKGIPGQTFSYNKYHPQLIGMILERTTGTTVTAYMQKKLWDPLGMQYPASWSTDSLSSDFEKMETGINARAIDFAKFGVLFLNKGNWQGAQIITPEWVMESSALWQPLDYEAYYTDWFSRLPGKAYYGYFWWGFQRDAHNCDFSAEGDRGQFIYISQSGKLVITRNATDYGIPGEEWLKLFYDFASQY